MNKSAFVLFLVKLSFLFLSACQTQLKPQAPIAEVSDPDIVVMQGLGVNRQSSSLLGVKPMTYEELLNCSKTIDHLNQQTIHLKIESAKIEKRKSELDRKNAELDTERPTLDPRMIKKVAEFNGRVEALRSSVGELDKDVSKYNNELPAQNIQTNEFNISCANRSYRQSDVAKLPSELIVAISLVSKESNIPIKDNSIEGASNGNVHLPGSSRH